MLAPLAAQNGRYIRTQTLYNRAAYDYVASKKLYLRSALPPIPMPLPAEPVVQLTDGAIGESPWLDLTGFPEAAKARYYVRPVMVRDANTGRCSTVSMGLLGLHIVQKTPSRPQWIWSTFEQVDRAPPARAGSIGHVRAAQWRRGWRSIGKSVGAGSVGEGTGEAVQRDAIGVVAV